MLNEIYKEYGEYFYVPMTQGYSIAIPITVGCSWNKCLYCDLNQGNKYRFLGLEEIDRRLKILKDYYSNRHRTVKKVVMAGGNPLCLDTNILIEIIKLIRYYFPHVDNISGFARANDILRKSKDELLRLKALGVGELSIGIESGNNEVLAFHNKGVTREDNYLALTRLEQCNISYSTYIMLGLGGRKLSKKHAIDTAKFLSEFNPDVIIVVTLVLFKNAKLVEKVRTKEFIRLRPLESLKEEKLLIENLNLKNTIFNGTHKTNALILKGRLPQQKDILLDKIHRELEEYNNEDMKDKEVLKWKRWSVE
ncbi:radical SAM protein [Tissierella pigra]|uniref:radical SAM protein n=1 Tax=Tissierella pigra TaxID=2607614 RepID=UPI001C117155|nr:radical SAM protein [Tissierella pigra]MBU5427452.1 radical SAM protein [Tissierella pigra]